MIRIKIVVVVLAGVGASAQESVPDKSAYTLLNPTPRELWRPLAADRPDVTESPYTVDAGAWQIEASFVDFARRGDDSAWAIAPTNLKLGLLNDVDIQLVVHPWLIEEGDARADGFGDTEVRLKINLWGNDEGRTAFAFMPAIKIPTASDGLGHDKIEGALIFPFAVELSDSVGLGLMFETDFVYDEASDGYEADFVTTAAFGFDVTERIGLYVEGVGVASSDATVDYRGLLGFGGTYEVNPDLVFDVGANLGLTGDVDDVNVFAGVTWRF